MPQQVFITREIPAVGAQRLAAAGLAVRVNPLQRPLSPDELAAYVADCDGLIPMLAEKVDAVLLNKCPRLKAVANYAVGFNNIDLAECTRRGVGVSNTPGVLTNATAELAWALLFAAARQVVRGDNDLRAGLWDGWGPMHMLGASISGRTLGVVGAGRIGERFALMSRGFNMPVLYASRRPNPVLDRELSARRVPLEELLKEADFVSLHVPLTPETQRLIGARELAAMKPSAILINTARGAVVDEPALIEALAAGRIGGAGLDVYESEPHVPQELLGLKNVVLLPHVGSATVEAREAMAGMAAENIIEMLAGRRPPNALNPEVWAGPRTHVN